MKILLSILDKINRDKNYAHTEELMEDKKDFAYLQLTQTV